MGVSVAAARVRFGLLWVAQGTRMLADNAMRAFVVLNLAQGEVGQRDSAWHIVAGILAAAAVLLAPLNGAVSNSLPRRGVLFTSTQVSLFVVGIFAYLQSSWTLAWGLLALSWVVYSPARYALLPAVADDTQIPLTRVTGLMDMGAFTATLLGLILGVMFPAFVPTGALLALTLSAAATLGINFPSDVLRPESLGTALRGFLDDCRRVAAVRPAVNSLLGLAVLRGLVSGAIGAFLAVLLRNSPDDPTQAALSAGLEILAGIAVGSLLAGIQAHPYRTLGLIPCGFLGLTIGLTLAALYAAGTVPTGIGFVIGLMGGIINVPLAATYQATVPADARGNAMALRNLAEYLCITLVSVGLAGLAMAELVTPAGQFALVALLAGTATLLTFWTLRRAWFELVGATVLQPVFRVHAAGPGLQHFPRTGPVLVAANHACWFDPMFLGKVVPRRIKPMMTSAFYDLPALRWLVKGVVGAIRVDNSPYRREAPELLEAVEALDAGECVVIFPEGRMRRKEERPLHPFGQGIWHILAHRPETPVVICWIEGNWGSFFSYWHGPPTKNKRFDWWRHINVYIGEPFVIDPALLAEHRPTRQYLHDRCLAMRPAQDAAAAAAEERVEHE